MYSYGACVNDLMSMISPGLSQKTVHMSPPESIKTRHSPYTPGTVSIEQSKIGVTANQSLGLGGGSAWAGFEGNNNSKARLRAIKVLIVDSFLFQ